MAVLSKIVSFVIVNFKEVILFVIIYLDSRGIIYNYYYGMVIDMIPFFSVFHDARSVILQLQKYVEDKTIFRSGSRRLVK